MAGNIFLINLFSMTDGVFMVTVIHKVLWFNILSENVVWGVKIYVKRPYKRGHVELNCVELASDRVQLRTYSFFAHRPPVSKITSNFLSSSVPARCLKKHLSQEHQRLLPQPHFSFTYWIKTAKGGKKGESHLFFLELLLCYTNLTFRRSVLEMSAVWCFELKFPTFHHSACSKEENKYFRRVS